MRPGLICLLLSKMFCVCSLDARLRSIFFSVFVQDDLRLPCGGSFGVNACLFCVVPNLFCVCLVETRLRSMRLWSVLCPL